MQLLKLLRAIADACEKLDLKYYVTGSVASSFYGVYRTTQDVDVVVELPSWKVRDFCAMFPDPDWYVDPVVAADAVQRSGMFNIVHNPTGLKIDVIPVKESPYDELRLDRARPVKAFGDRAVKFAAPEDVILMKLVFSREGGSEKHARDIKNMFDASGKEFDMGYVEMWALRIGVHHQWAALKAELGIVYPPANDQQ